MKSMARIIVLWESWRKGLENLSLLDKQAFVFLDRYMPGSKGFCVRSGFRVKSASF